jgi:EAL domain-containing protein (putative c-di-GMP-specific phosphodiesterase class I)
LQFGRIAPLPRVGAALFPDHARDVGELMRLADAALKKARGQHDAYAICDQQLRVEEERRLDLKSSLKVALDNSDLMLHYQPQVDLQEGVVSGCEALVRWNQAGHGWVSPDLFIPVAESSDLIDTLTYWSVNVALREWFAAGSVCAPHATVSVNLSARLLHSSEVVELVRRAMNIWGTDPDRLVLEVTESAMMTDPAAARRTLQALADFGVTLSIDDKSFVSHMAQVQQDRKIVQSVIDLAHNLDLKVVAEGIENQQTLDMLIGMGCDYGQGYYIARPMALADLPPWVDSSNWERPGALAR